MMGLRDRCTADMWDVLSEFTEQTNPLSQNPCGIDNYKFIRIWKATDNCGNVNEVTQVFNVLPDTDLPYFDAQPGVIGDVNCDEGLPVQEVLSASDNCSTVVVVPSVDTYVVDNCGGYTVTYRWIATDACGNASEVTQSFNVLPDSEVPMFTSTPSVIGDVNCNDPLPTQEVLSATDACVSLTVVPSVDAYTVDICNGYAVTYRWTATDNCGNVNEVTQVFNVLPDTDAPVFAVQPSLISDINCDDPLPTQEVLNATDDCSAVTVVPSIDAHTVDICNG